VGERIVSGGAWSRIAGRPTGPASFWKYNWLAVHQIIAALRRAAPHARGALLDVGCGSRPFERYLAGRVTRVVGSDLPDSRFVGNARVDVYARGEALPFRTGSFDTVMALSVLTYLRDPGALPREAARVLKPGGALLFEATQMAPLHDPPHDYFRFTVHGARHLAEAAGLEWVEAIPIGGMWARAGLALIAPLNRLNRGPARILTELPVRALYVVIQLGCAAMDRMFFTPGDHLGHLCVARKGRAPAEPAPTCSR
jgi:SAM-dependent methyltransferase